MNLVSFRDSSEGILNCLLSVLRSFPAIFHLLLEHPVFQLPVNIMF